VRSELTEHSEAAKNCSIGNTIRSSIHLPAAPCAETEAWHGTLNPVQERRAGAFLLNGRSGIER
jgi:hypothetical protein